MIRKASLIAAITMLGWSAPALAGDATASSEPVSLPVDAQGYVSARVVLPQSAAVIQAYLANPMNAMRLAPEVLDAQATPHGKCSKVDVKAKGLFSPLKYTVLRCPTSAGFTEKLLESSDFDSMDVEWTITETSDGTIVTVKNRTRLSFPVPESTLTRVASQSLRTTLSRLKSNVEDED